MVQGSAKALSDNDAIESDCNEKFVSPRVYELSESHWGLVNR